MDDAGRGGHGPPSGRPPARGGPAALPLSDSRPQEPRPPVWPRGRDECDPRAVPPPAPSAAAPPREASGRHDVRQGPGSPARPATSGAGPAPNGTGAPARGGVPPLAPRRIDALLDSATRPLRGWLPRPGDLPTRRLPRAVDAAGDPPTALLAVAAAGSAPGAIPAAPPTPSAVPPEPAAPAAVEEPGTHDDPDEHPGEPAGEPRASSPDLRRSLWPQRDPRTLKRALLAAAVSTVAPGAGHLLLRRRVLGAVLLGVFVFGVALIAVLAATLPSAQLLENLLSTRVLIVGALACLVAAVAWMAVIVHAYRVGRPARLRTGQRLVGVATVTALCLVVAAPLGLAAYLANSQRSLLDALFPSGGEAAAIGKPRLNIMLVGSDAGPDRTGTRTDTMMVASIDTKSGRTTLFGLPRNIGFARFPPGSPMADEFPDGFHDDSDPLSGDYLLNAVYAYGHAYPKVAPRGPTSDPGLNLLQSSISYMLGLPIDYQIVVDMAGFAALIDALGGVQVDVGPERVPIGGIGPHGEAIRPKGYIQPGVQQLSGEEALAFARSRTGSTDYVRMGRQRCLIQYVLDQKSPTDLLTNFQAVARATTDNVSTNIPREVLPALVALAGSSGVALESVAFDPNLPDPNAPDGKFNTYRPDIPYMREVVREAISRPAAPPPSSASAAPPEDLAASAYPDDSDDSAAAGTSTKPITPGASSTKRSGSASASRSATAPASAAPTPLAQSC